MPDVGETVRVDISELNRLVNIAGEVETNRIKIEEREKKFSGIGDLLIKKEGIWRNIREKVLDNKVLFSGLENFSNDVVNFDEINNQVDKNIGEYIGEYSEDIVQLFTYLRELYSMSMELRLLPLAVVFDVFPFTVQQLAKEYNRKIDFEVEGGATKLDKKIIDGIKDPLLHIVRNAIAHGIEPVEERAAVNKPDQGRIDLRAYQEGDLVFVEIVDDGKGIDPEKIRNKAVELGIIDRNDREMTEHEIMSCIFKPGFTTATEVSEISGRGVGMDVVKKDIENLGGAVTIETKVGEGTRILLQLPLTLTTANALMVELNDQIFAIQSSMIDTTVIVNPEDVKVINNETVIVLEQKIIPIEELKGILQMGDERAQSTEDKRLSVIVISYANSKIGLVVDKFIENREVVIKELGDFLSKVRFLSGAAILPEGKVAFILHIPYLMGAIKAGTRRRAPIVSMEKFKVEEKIEGERAYSILIVDDALTTRELA
ncbi:chemotaxis protein CheA [Elusimicrobiota bacterium]